jgi:hypothetical protein
MKIEGSRPLLFRFRDGDWSSEWKKGGASAEKAAGVPAASGP